MLQGATPGSIRFFAVVISVLVALGTGIILLSAHANDYPSTPDYTLQTGGNPTQGTAALMRYGCGACHLINGVPGAMGAAGPALNNFGRNSYIAGTIPNVPNNLIRFIQNAQEVVPGGVMPTLNIPEPSARDMAAYLYTLK